MIREQFPDLGGFMMAAIPPFIDPTFTDERIKRFLAETPKKCSLCNRRPRYFGTYRGRKYAICTQCSQKEDWHLHVVAKLPATEPDQGGASGDRVG
jgi:hypothetical protein